MEFGYFTLSDNRYPDNPRTSEQFLLEIRDQAIYAEELGMHSAWIGEHHFNRRGCVPVPGLTLANIAASTKRIRLGPAVVVLNIHHPIHVAEEWGALDQLSGGRVDFACGRGYDAHEFVPFGADFQASAEQFTEAVQLLTKCWTETEPFTFDGEFYSAPDPIVVDPKPMQDPFRPYMGSFSSFSMEIAADLDWNLLQAPFAATMVFGGLEQAVQAYRDICEKKEKEARKVKCSYFIHMGTSDADKDYALARLIDYFTLSGLRKKSTQGGAVAADHAVLPRYRQSAGRSEKRRLRSQLHPIGRGAGNHRSIEEGRRLRHRRGHLVFQSRRQARCHGARADAALHGRGGARLRGQPHRCPGRRINN